MATMARVKARVAIMKRKKSAKPISSESIEKRSLEKRETMRPRGVVSKKESGARITRRTS